ncbi:hypothetical protein RYA05_01965 [Pseudomonas syringae pv. actinidiae]|nr:hypothetical protein [Pseudomonas syringae pv. actinidiae]
MWNYRIATKVEEGKKVFGMIECTYDRHDSNKIDCHSDFIDLGNYASEDELKRSMGYMVAAFDKPVLDGLDFSNAIHPDMLIDDLSDSEMDAIRKASSASGCQFDAKSTRHLFG